MIEFKLALQIIKVIDMAKESLFIIKIMTKYESRALL